MCQLDATEIVEVYQKKWADKYAASPLPTISQAAQAQLELTCAARHSHLSSICPWWVWTMIPRRLVQQRPLLTGGMREAEDDYHASQCGQDDNVKILVSQTLRFSYGIWLLNTQT